MSPCFPPPFLFRPPGVDGRRVRRRRLAGALAAGLLLSAPVVLPAAEAAAPATRSRTAPIAVRTVTPVHPAELRLANGEAVLECLVDENGEVHDVKMVSETHPGFAAAAEAALLQWKFQPGTLEGRPRAVRLQVPFEFRLSPDQVLTALAGRQVYAEITETIIPARQLPAWPRPVQFYVPRYPPEFAGTGKYGKAVVNITIDKEGKVMNPRLVKATYPEFVLPAMVTAMQLNFPPQVMADGNRIHVNMDIQFDFKPPSSMKPARAKK